MNHCFRGVEMLIRVIFKGCCCLRGFFQRRVRCLFKVFKGFFEGFVARFFVGANEKEPSTVVMNENNLGNP